MDGWVRVLRPFNSISVISRRWKGEHERLCAMKRRLRSGRISPPAGFEPATPWSEVDRSTTRTLLWFKWESEMTLIIPGPLRVQYLPSFRVVVFSFFFFFLYHTVFLCNNSVQTWFSCTLTFAGALGRSFNTSPGAQQMLMHRKPCFFPIITYLRQHDCDSCRCTTAVYALELNRFGGLKPLHNLTH